MIETLITLIVWGVCLGFGLQVGSWIAASLGKVLRYLFTGENTES
jgi:hypothetical protein